MAGKQRVRVRFSVRKSLRVKRVRFYAQGKLIATDRRAPFAVNKRAVINTNALPAGPARLKFKVRCTLRRHGGKVVTRTLRRTVAVDVFRPPSDISPLAAGLWKQVFNDDFTTPAASLASWATQREDWLTKGTPYSNLEGAGYLPSNVKIANGTLDIATSNTPASGFNQSTGSINTHHRFAFKYGYIESRILVPTCDGCWPAFWLLPSADRWPPEIDIIEYFDTAKQKIPYSAVHWPANNAQREEYFSQRLMLADTDNYVGTWHTYGMFWTGETVQFYLDGVPGPQFSKPSRIPQEAMYPIIQLAVGAGHRPAAGSTMQVDYVRAWQRAG